MATYVHLIVDAATGILYKQNYSTGAWEVWEGGIGAGGTLKIPNDGLIQLGVLDGSPEVFGGNATYPHEVFIQAKDGDRIGELGIYPKGTQDSSLLELSNDPDPANPGFVHFIIDGLVVILQPGQVGTGVAPTSFRIKFDMLPETSVGYGLGNATYWWKHVKAQYYHLLSAFGSDHTWTGLVTVDITAGENLVFGDAVYMKSDGKAWKADADLATTMPIFGIAVATINAEATGEILTQGWIRDDSFSLTAGGIVYASVTAGGISGTALVGSGDEADYGLLGGDELSLGGYITAVGWTGKISGVTNPAKIMGVAVANIAKVKGVA